MELTCSFSSTLLFSIAKAGHNSSLVTKITLAARASIHAVILRDDLFSSMLGIGRLRDKSTTLPESLDISDFRESVLQRNNILLAYVG